MNAGFIKMPREKQNAIERAPALLKVLCSLALTLFMVLFNSAAFAAEHKQDLQEIRDAAKQFLTKETAGLPGQISIEIGKLDPLLSLEHCTALEPFMPTGSHLWGKTSVGVRCNAPQQWQVYVSSTIKIWGTYYLSAKSIAQGQIITESDITSINGELTSLASGIVTQPSQAIGHASTMSIAAGIPLRQDSLRLQQVVAQGQTIRLISIGTGFRVSTEAQALTGGSEGQLVKVKTGSGQVLSGIARMGGIVEVNN